MLLPESIVSLLPEMDFRGDSLQERYISPNDLEEW
ncbi:uncharacterized protein J3R85_006333 [Psidium guajava]|nr:uncharacterized protein J3R85_006333 [Psidium guajava]